MAKLYPPQVEGILPAFYKRYKDNKVIGATLTIPFGMNRAVAIKEVSKLAIRLKTVSTNTQMYLDESDTVDFTNLSAVFTMPEKIADKINEGQFYKAQLAFIDNTGTTGYWSTVGTIKCVSKPTVTIANFDEKQVNGFTTEFIGEYQQDTTFGDSTEKVETYEFNVWDLQNNLILSSGTKLHNSADDISSSGSTDSFKTNHEISEGQMYYIQYSVTTLNNLQISSPLYKIMQTESVNIEYPLELHCRNNFEEGYIELYLQGVNKEVINPVTQKTTIQEQMYTGTFLITRGSDKDDYFEWNEIIRFNMDSGYPSQYKFRDFTVEQGIRYKYRIQQYNIHKMYSNAIYLTDVNTKEEISVMADFEDMFIYDGTRQLKVRFNPKVTSFKNTIPEQKIETIGSKYPFIFRNGHVNYKEFPISGLISYTMDDAMLFLNDSELEEAKILEPTYVRIGSGYFTINEATSSVLHESSLVYNPETKQLQKVSLGGAQPMVYNDEWHPGKEKIYNDTNRLGETLSIKDRIVRQNKDLTSLNIMGERYFKLKVLDWLTNGEVKLFRSPTEGNYLVRILNVSMSPNDTLGRMLHTFTGTCYEIDDLTYDNLLHYGIVTENVVSLTEMHWGSENVNKIIASYNGTSGNTGPWYQRFIYKDNGEIAIDEKGDQIRQSYKNWDGFYTLPLNSNTILGFTCTDFAPGDIIEVMYAGVEETEYIAIGITGSYNYDYDNRIITSIAVKPNPDHNNITDYSRIISYKYEGLQNRKFDTISNINIVTQIAKQYIGYCENVVQPLVLRNLNDFDGIIPESKGSDNFVNAMEQIKAHPNIYLSDNVVKFDILQIEILHAQARQLIPIYSLGLFSTDTNNNIIEPVYYVSATVFAPNKTYYIKNDNDEYELAVIDPDVGFEEGIKYWQKKSGYALTPFGIGYVNYDTIYEVPVGHVATTQDDVLQQIIDNYPKQYISIYDLEEINTVLQDDLLTPIGGYSVLQVFVPVIEDGIFIEWEPTNYFYDTYTHKWNHSYDPYISITNEGGEIYSSFQPNKMEYDINGKIIDFDAVDYTMAIQQQYKKNTQPYNSNTEYYIFDEILWKYIKVEPDVETFNQNTYYVSNFNYIPLQDINRIYLDDIEEITYTNLGKVRKLEIGNGAMVEITFQLQVVDYDIEESNAVVYNYRQDYLASKYNETTGYFNRLINYYNQYTVDNAALEEQEKKLKSEIKQLAKDASPATITEHEYDEDFDINYDENGNPRFNNNNSEFQKIIDNVTAVLDDITAAKPLKGQMISLQTQLFHDLLYGWNSDIQEFIQTTDLSQQVTYYIKNDNGDYIEALPTDTSQIYYIKALQHHYGLLEPELAPVEFCSEDLIQPGDNYYNSSITNNEDSFMLTSLSTDNAGSWPKRWLSENYSAQNNAHYPIYNYVVTSTDNTLLTQDETMDFIVDDIGYKDIINAIIRRVDTSKMDKFSGYELGPQTESNDFTFDLEQTIGNASWNENNMSKRMVQIDSINVELVKRNNLTIYDNNQVIVEEPPAIPIGYYVLWTEYYKAQMEEKNYYSLQEYIAKNRYNLNIIKSMGESLDADTSISVQLEQLQKYLLDLLYLIYHKPVLNNNGIINDFERMQNQPEEDYAETELLAKTLFTDTLNPTELIGSIISKEYSENSNNIFAKAYVEVTDEKLIDNMQKQLYWSYDRSKLSEEQINMSPILLSGVTLTPIVINAVYEDGTMVSCHTEFEEQEYAIVWNNDKHYWSYTIPAAPNSEESDKVFSLWKPVITVKDEMSYDKYANTPLSYENTIIIYDPSIENDKEVGKQVLNISDVTNQELQQAKQNVIDLLLTWSSDYLSNEFWNNAIGCFVESKDDLLIALHELIEALVPIKILQVDQAIIKEHRDNIRYTNDLTVSAYLDQLDTEISNSDSKIATWTSVYDQTSIVLSETSNEAKREELLDLLTTAKINIALHKANKETAERSKAEFMKSDLYLTWEVLKEKAEQIEKMIERAVKPYDEASKIYAEKKKIYNLLRNFAKDLLVQSRAESSSTTQDINDTNIITSYLTEYLDHINLSQYLELLQQILNTFITDDDKIIIQLGYFNLDSLMEAVANSNITYNDLLTFDKKLDFYNEALDALRNHYDDMLYEIEHLQKLYNNRGTFLQTLTEIIKKYQTEISEAQTELLSKIKALITLQTQLSNNETNEPKDSEILKIYQNLTAFLIILQRYYIIEVEGRYSV